MTHEERKRRKAERRQARAYAREQDARTFSELVAAYKTFFGLTMNEGAWEILQAVREVAKEFPGLDVWDNLFGPYPVVEDELLFTAQGYDPRRGTFTALFRNNLLFRLRRDASRLAKQRRKAAAANEHRDVPLVRAALRARPEPDEVAAAHERWASRLLELALVRLSRHKPLVSDFIVSAL